MPPKIELATGDNGFQHLAIPDDYLRSWIDATDGSADDDTFSQRESVVAALWILFFRADRAPSAMMAGRRNGSSTAIASQKGGW